MDDAAARMGRQLARRSSRLPLESFVSAHLVPHSLCGSLRCFLTEDDLCRVINFFSYAVVSLGLSVSALTAPVTDQAQDLQNNERSSPLRPLSGLWTQKIFGSRPCPNRVCQDSWLLANPSWLTAWAVKMVMTWSGWAGTDDQSGLVALYQHRAWFTVPTPILI